VQHACFIDKCSHWWTTMDSRQAVALLRDALSGEEGEDRPQFSSLIMDSNSAKDRPHKA
jgi:hypothetical protein